MLVKGCKWSKRWLYKVLNQGFEDFSNTNFTVNFQNCCLLLCLLVWCCTAKFVNKAGKEFFFFKNSLDFTWPFSLQRGMKIFYRFWEYGERFNLLIYFYACRFAFLDCSLLSMTNNLKLMLIWQWDFCTNCHCQIAWGLNNFM